MDNKPNLSKDLILKTSARLFREKSYAQVSMRGIAEVLNVKAASLYNHIQSKDEILEGVIFKLVDTFMQTIEKTSKKDNTTAQKLLEIIKTHIDIAVESPNSFATLNNDWIYLREEKRNEFITSRNAYEKQLETILTKGMQLNEIKKVNSKIMIYQLLSPLRNIHQWNRKNYMTTDELKSQLPQLILGGLLK
jgi:AcrR family transcriptional regulator